jgi:catechol 2,3-dioxygenase-like lactoylglutathione lyase family enzyme
MGYVRQLYTLGMRIGMVMLGVRDVSAAAAFYREKLGLAPKGQFEGFAFFEAGPVTLVLSDALAKNRDHVAGATELVFPVDHVGESYRELKAAGVTFLNEPRVVTGASWGVNFTDPDGHWLSLFGPE